MPPGMKQHKTYLDGKRCLEVWCKTGSVYKSRLVLFSEGYKNPATGEMPSHQGVWNASALFMINNPLEARAMVEDVWKQHGEILKDTDWYMMMTKNARYIMSDKAFRVFLEKNAYLKPYEQMARERVKSKRTPGKGQELHPVAVSE